MYKWLGSNWSTISAWGSPNSLSESRHLLYGCRFRAVVIASLLAGVRSVLGRPAFSSAIGNVVRVPRRRWTTWATVTLCDFPCVITSSTIAGTAGLCIRLLFGQSWVLLCTFCWVYVIVRFIVVTNESFKKSVAPFDRDECVKNQMAQSVSSVIIPTHLLKK
jgi:hypothetical protein